MNASMRSQIRVRLENVSKSVRISNANVTKDIEEDTMTRNYHTVKTIRVFMV